MGLDKDTASARISRYESGAMSISLEALFELAQALDVPPAYLLATTAGMADAILALGIQSEAQQTKLAQALQEITSLPPRQRKRADDFLGGQMFRRAAQTYVSMAKA